MVSLAEIRIDSSKFMKHSFRIGAATTVRARIVQDSNDPDIGILEKRDILMLHSQSPAVHPTFRELKQNTNFTRVN